MPAERTAMRCVREVLRLRTAGVSGNEIARRLNLAPSTVRLTLQRLTTAGLSWPLPTELTDAALEVRLFSAVGTKQGHRRRAEPDWAEVHRELKRKHVTLQILWDEYIERCPDGYRYSRFCELYRNWASRLSVTMRQSHSGGDSRHHRLGCRAGRAFDRDIPPGRRKPDRHQRAPHQSGSDARSRRCRRRRFLFC